MRSDGIEGGAEEIEESAVNSGDNEVEAVEENEFGKLG